MTSGVVCDQTWNNHHLSTNYPRGRFAYFDGCEERLEDSKAKVLVTLVDESGQERLIRVEDEWLYAKGIDEGDRWPESLLAAVTMP